MDVMNWDYLVPDDDDDFDLAALDAFVLRDARRRGNISLRDHVIAHLSESQNPHPAPDDGMWRHETG